MAVVGNHAKESLQSSPKKFIKALGSFQATVLLGVLINVCSKNCVSGYYLAYNLQKKFTHNCNIMACTLAQFTSAIFFTMVCELCK